MAEKLTRVQNSILSKVLENGGSWTSLFKLSLELGIHYGHSFSCVNRLEELNLLTVERKAGSPMRMYAVERMTSSGYGRVTGGR